MCDVLVALPDSTKHNRIIFSKNSDRPAGESQVLYFSTGKKRQTDGNIQCSYIKVPETKEVLSTLGCRPYWCWGYETGMNEADVVGGNAAIFTKSLHDPDNQGQLGLTGMELLRLGLERGHTAKDAVDVIINLLEKYGQWGSAVIGVKHEKGSYDNSFLLADKDEAWVLETSGRRWVAERIRSGIRSISNEPTIRNHWDGASNDLKDFARQSGWWNPAECEFDFAYVYGDHEHYSRQVSHIRWKRTNQLLKRYNGEINVAIMMKILRDHYEDTFLDGPQFHPYLPDFHSICMHDSPAHFTWGNTATSVIVELDPKGAKPPLIWFAYLPPCSSVYTALQFSKDIPDIFTRVGKSGMKVYDPTIVPKDEFDYGSLWWRLYRLIKEVRKDPIIRHKELRALLDPIENYHINRVAHVLGDRSEMLRTGLNQLVQEHIEEITKALKQLEKQWKVDPA